MGLHCLQCEFRQRPCAGACECKLDGVGVAVHAREGYCPHPSGPKFGDGTRKVGKSDAAPSALPLGDMVASLAKIVGADKAAKLYERFVGKPCGCPERQAKLNQLGAAIRRRLSSP